MLQLRSLRALREALPRELPQALARAAALVPGAAAWSGACPLGDGDSHKVLLVPGAPCVVDVREHSDRVRAQLWVQLQGRSFVRLLSDSCPAFVRLLSGRRGYGVF